MKLNTTETRKVEYELESFCLHLLPMLLLNGVAQHFRQDLSILIQDSPAISSQLPQL
jgi:hypothetical protein